MLTVSRKDDHSALWIGAAFAAAVGLAALVLAVAGPNDHSVHLALQATARLMFLVFFLAYTGSALASLLGAAFQPLRRHARELGLAFAAMLAVHLGLVAWICSIGDVPASRTFVIFGVAALCVYGMALFSIGRLQRFLGAQFWWAIRFLGMNYVLLAFAEDFLRNPLGDDFQQALFYWPFTALVIIAPALRVAAFLQQGLKRWMPSRQSSRRTPVSGSPTP